MTQEELQQVFGSSHARRFSASTMQMTKAVSEMGVFANVFPHVGAYSIHQSVYTPLMHSLNSLRECV
jgi:hypothetical protein